MKTYTMELHFQNAILERVDADISLARELFYKRMARGYWWGLSKSQFIPDDGTDFYPDEEAYQAAIRELRHESSPENVTVTYSGAGGEDRNKKFVLTGEFRAPKNREWFLSGAVPEAYQCVTDALLTDYAILVPVEPPKQGGPFTHEDAKRLDGTNCMVELDGYYEIGLFRAMDPEESITGECYVAHAKIRKVIYNVLKTETFSR